MVEKACFFFTVENTGTRFEDLETILSCQNLTMQLSDMIPLDIASRRQGTLNSRILLLKWCTWKTTFAW